VPMLPVRLLRRRYNQSAVLAHGLGAITDIEVVATALRRTRRMPTQSGLGRKAREENLRRMMAPTEVARPKLGGNAYSSSTMFLQRMQPLRRPPAPY
jgi:predicted amidophosphoribosyltransferase